MQDESDSVQMNELWSVEHGSGLLSVSAPDDKKGVADLSFHTGRGPPGLTGNFDVDTPFFCRGNRHPGNQTMVLDKMMPSKFF